MPGLNFGVLQPLQQQAKPLLGQAPSLPSMGGGGEADQGIGDLFKGAGTLMKAFQRSDTPTSEQPAMNPEIQNAGGTYGMNLDPSTSNPNAQNQPLGQQGSEAHNLFELTKPLLGTNEQQNAPVLMSFFKKAGIDMDPRTTPWCTAFVNAALQQTGQKGSGSDMARSFLKWGEATDKPTPGDVVVMSFTPGDPNKGHVGFFAGYDENGKIKVLGGNQSDGVNVKSYSMENVLGFRRPPTGQQLQQQAAQSDLLTPPSSTTDLIKGFEGFYSKPYWDVNAHRIGYGSDTITKADGSIVKVKPGMTVTKEDAERDLKRRTVEFENTAISQVGAGPWSKLPPNARAALVSVAYNYGSLPKRVVPAVQSGNLEQISDAIRSLGKDNKGINKGRRNKEAQLVMTQNDSKPEDFYSGRTGVQGLPENSRIQTFKGDPNIDNSHQTDVGNLAPLDPSNGGFRQMASAPLPAPVQLANSTNPNTPPNLPMFNGQKPLREMTPQEIRVLMKFNAGNLGKLVG